MATTTLLLNGFSIVGDPQKANANASGSGEYMLKSGTSLFEDDDIVVFVAENVTDDGVLTDASEITQIIVYENASDYYNDIAKYTYSGTADIQEGRHTMGDRYLEFEADGLTSGDAGAPVLGTLTAIAGVDIQAVLASQSGPLRIDTNEDIDLNGDGIISGDEIADGSFSSSVTDGTVVICFAAGTLIETPKGPKYIETLRSGDHVNTLDAGAQEITWIGRARVAGGGVNTPILIRRGALENIRDLWVSPNHRMLLRGPSIELLFGEAEVLVAAKHLVNGKDIVKAPCPSVEYWHFMCKSHHLVFAEGCVAETLFPGNLARNSMIDFEQDEILDLLPNLPNNNFEGPLARYTLKRHEAKALMERAA